MNDVTTCQLQCTSDLTLKTATVIDQNGNEIDAIVCEMSNGNGPGTASLLPPSDTLELECAETKCGALGDVVTVGVDVVTMCSDTQCTFTCPNGKQASHKVIKCNDDGTYDASNVIVECNDPIDTPCGNVEDTFTTDNTVAITCGLFDPI